MHRTIRNGFAPAAAALLLAWGCSGSSSDAPAAASFTFGMDALKWQPAPAGVLPGRDGNPEGRDGSHHPAEDCGICHAPASTLPNSVYTPAASGRVFTLTATVMDGRGGRRPVEGAEILLLDAAGKAVSFTTNRFGNAWTEAEITPDLAVSTTFAPSAWRYKAWVKDGGLARPMMTIPAVGGMSVPRMSCGMHHVTTGTMGALSAGPGPVLRTYPLVDVSFRRHVFPILRARCAPCHVPGPTGASQNGETFDYGAGLDLMSLDGSDVTLHGTAGDTRYVKRGVRQVANLSAPDESLVLRKPLSGSTHGGGAFWPNRDHPDYAALRRWIAEGARDN